MFRREFLVILGLVVIASFGRLAAQSDPFLGVWELNSAKSSITRGSAPLNEIVVIVPEPGALKPTLVMLGEGQGRAELYHYRFDGNPHPTEGGDPRHVTFRRVGPRSAVITVIRAGQVTATRQMELSEDGRTLSFNATGSSASGTPYANDLRMYDKTY